MKKDQLKNFVEVADCGSINKAAEKLYISQPSLSRSIHALEEEMGRKLFYPLKSWYHPYTYW